MAEKLHTPEFRGWFAHLNKPKGIKGDPDSTPVYQVMCVLDKDDEWWDELEDAVERAAKEKWGEIPRKFKSPIKDGDTDGDYDDLKGMMFFNASNDRRPGIVDENLDPIMDPEELYSGAWYRISINVYAWEHPTGGKGCGIGLNNVMKIRDDDRLDGGESAEKDFAGFAKKGGSKRRRGRDDDDDDDDRGSRRGRSRRGRSRRSRDDDDDDRGSRRGRGRSRRGGDGDSMLD